MKMSFKNIAFIGALFVLFAGFAAAADITGFTVTLVGPADGNWNASAAGTLNFTFNVTQAIAPSACYLFTNYSANTTGSWGISSSNQTTISNGSVQLGISNYSLPGNGTVKWNVNCTTANGTYSNFSASNYTLNFDNSQPIITMLSPANGTYVNRTTVVGGAIGNMTFQFNVTGINVTYGANKVWCTIFEGANYNHTTLANTSFGATRTEHLQIPQNQSTLFNVTCTTPAFVNGSNGTTLANGIVVRAFYVNPLVPTIRTPASNASWVNSAYLALNFTNNHTFFYNESKYLNCSLYFNTTYNQSNATVGPNKTSQAFTISTGAGWDGWWQLNVTCTDVAGNMGYNDSWFLGLDRSVNYSGAPWLGSNFSGAADSSAFHWAYWTDVRNLSGFIFASNYSGSWANDSWVALYAGTDIVTGNYSNVTKTISGSIGQNPSYYICVNDSLNNWGCTPMTQLTVLTTTTGGTGSTPTATPTPTTTSTPAPTGTPTYRPTTTPTLAPTGTATAGPEVSGEQPTATLETPVSEARARAEVSTAQEAIALAKTQGVSSPEAERLLALAQQALTDGQYALALENAQLAQNALATAKTGAKGGVAGGVDFTLVAVIIVLVLIGAAYLFYSRKKKKGM